MACFRAHKDERKSNISKSKSKTNLFVQERLQNNLFIEIKLSLIRVEKSGTYKLTDVGITQLEDSTGVWANGVKSYTSNIELYKKIWYLVMKENKYMQATNLLKPMVI